MAYEPKPNSGSLFENKTKQGTNHPDYRGDCLVSLDCPHCGANVRQRLSLACWWNEARTTGQTYLSVKISEWRDSFKKAGKTEAAREARSLKKELDDEIPF